jgi:hypothetical protein
MAGAATGASQLGDLMGLVLLLGQPEHNKQVNTCAAHRAATEFENKV